MPQPDHLAVYLSNSCNLACSYCYVAVNQGPQAVLAFDDIKKSIDEFYDKVASPDKKITFLGGEPLQHWALFQQAAKYARSRPGGHDVVLQTFTNGTLLTPDKLAFLDELDCHVTISLDGRKAANDKHRVYFKAKDRSTFDDVMARVKELPKQNLGVSLVFTSETVEELLPNIDYFYQMGFGRITFNPELYETWTNERLELMKAQLRGLARYYKLLLQSGKRVPQIQILYSVLQNVESNRAGVKWWHDCHNVVLGPDAEYYACDKALTLPIGTAKNQRVGGPSTGMKWQERREHFDRAIEGIEKLGAGKDEIFCPMGVYFYAEEAKRDPAPLVANFEKVAKTFADGLLELVAQVEGFPAFQEMYVRARVV